MKPKDTQGSRTRMRDAVARLQKAGVSIKNIADRTGCTVFTAYNWKQGKSGGTEDTVKQLEKWAAKLEKTSPRNQPEQGRQEPPAPGQSVSVPGMTLRDWFAGQALAGIVTIPATDTTNAMLAKVAYSMADAMLAEREKDSDS